MKHIKMPKILAMLLVAVMLLNIVAIKPVDVSAAAPATYTNITAGESKSVSISTSGSAKYFRFVPTASGSYTFYSSNNSGDPYGSLLDSNGTVLASNDDYASPDRNFRITRDLTAGTTYYLKAAMYSSGTGSYTLKLVCNSVVQDLNPVQIQNGVNTYSLFNSGATTTDGYDQCREPNPAPSTHNNNGYDLYGTIGNTSKRRFRLGQSFTVNTTVTEQATLNILAWDVDESVKACGYGYEYDYIDLIDETANTTVRLDGHMSGQDDTWNTSIFRISPDLLQTGHTYHFELYMTCTSGSCSYYSVAVRTVSLIINGQGGAQTGIESAELEASVSSGGVVSASLAAKAYASGTYTLEYKAVHSASGAQYGGKSYSVTIPTTQTTFETTFSLESGAPSGTYIITVFIKNAAGDVVATREVTAGYEKMAVSYNSNGGSQNLPLDTREYAAGDTVTVLFDYVPSRSGYTFLGWARTASAMAAEFTANGTKTFTMGSEDVTLYAVWQESAHTPGSADVWDGTIATAFGGGTGSQSNPYLIYTAEQLAYLAKTTNAGNNYSGKYFKLMNDLDLNNLEWTPIGTEARNFYGHFDGNYHTIYNLRITGEMEFAGLFGCTKSGSIARLGVVNGYVNTYYNLDPVHAGILLGRGHNVDVSHCYVEGEVTAKSSKVSINHCVKVGVIAGELFNGATLKNSYGKGTVYGEMTERWNAYAGGLIGSGNTNCDGLADAYVENCYFVGSVVSKGVEKSYAGGICTVGGPTIKKCFTVGTLTAYRGTGGYSIANIAADNPWGDPIVSGCYHDNSLYAGNSTVTSTQGTATSRSNFQSQSWITSNLGWDFTSVWTFVAGEEYPVLQGFTQGGGGGNAHVHTPGDWIVDVEPTCTTSGSKHTECTVCGYELENIYIPALEHSYDSVVTKEATCTEPGIVTHTCIRCSDSYLTYIYSEHNYVVTDRQDATCTVDGYITYTCSICDDSYNEIIEGGHNYIAEITRVATATTDGEITYTCEICGDSYVEIIPARPDAKVLLIQDRLPWSENNNVSLLNKMLADGFITGWDMTTTANFSASMLGGYGVVLIANDQTTATYNQLRNIQDALVSFANAGGVVIYGACDEGWAAGSINHTLPAGAQKIHYYSRYNYIVDPSHPIVTGAYTDGKPLTNTLLYGNYCSHTAFGNLPAGSNVILQDGRGNPTLVEYAVGEGHMILSGLTWEFYYVRGAYNGISNTTYTKNVYDDLIMYALQLSDSCDHAYDAGQIVAPTCDEQGYTLHTCALCGTTMKDTFVDATGHTPGDWVVVTQATSTSEGLKTISCTACGEVLDREVIPMLNAPVISVCVEVDSVILGQTFDAYVVVSGSNPVKSVAFVPTFDTELFELVSVQWLKQATIQVTDPEIASAWSTATDINGDLLKLTFRAKGLTAGSRITSEAYIQNNGVVQVSVVGDSIAVVECPHEQFEISGVDGSYHVNVCCVCGYNVLSEHTFDHACDTQCNECDYTRAISHAPGSMMYDNEYHWIACTVCGEHLEVQAHVFDHGCDATCNACGFSRVTGHTPGEPEYDNDQHWIACTVCGEYLEVQAHEFDHDCDSDCYFCGYTRTITHAPGGWEMDADCHWQVCGICGETLEYHEHEYDSAIDCVCNICDYRRVLRGDVDGDGDVDSDDSIHLLMHTYFPQNYTLNQEGDMDGDGDLDSDDSIHLLMYTYFPEYYPLYDPDEECL